MISGLIIIGTIAGVCGICYACCKVAHDADEAVIRSEDEVNNWMLGKDNEK